MDQVGQVLRLVLVQQAGYSGVIRSVTAPAHHAGIAGVLGTRPGYGPAAGEIELITLTVGQGFAYWAFMKVHGMLYLTPSLTS